MNNFNYYKAYTPIVNEAHHCIIHMSTIGNFLKILLLKHQPV